MKSAFDIMKFIWNHPLASKRRSYAIRRFFNWQISQRIFPAPVIFPFVENSVLIVEKGMTGATGNIYTGLMDFEEMSFVLHLLRENDLFADIGANIGVFSVLASVNAGANTVAIEPVPGTFSRLVRNIRANNMSEKICPRQIGVGSERGEILFSSNHDTINHVLTDWEIKQNVPSVKVHVSTIDEIFNSECPCLIKMDVEGFEWPALQGAKRTMSDSRLKAIIIEINGSGSSYGISDDEIHSFLLSQGLTPYSYEPFSRTLTSLDKYGPTNTIYLRDPEWIEQRVSTARKFEIFNCKI
ncbi:MAG: FkbM family methyltransferase [Bacteroidetes bacterium]|nr:MAG: FkbM family methyltransferase [Bacteroidota bacterium]